MSVHVISWVLRHSEAEKAERLVLIVLADRADADGGEAYPTVKLIRRETRLKSDRTVQAALRGLEDAGRIVAQGVGPNGATSYRVVMSEGGAKIAGGAKKDATPRKKRRQPPAKNDAGLHTEPSLRQPSIEPTRSSADAVDPGEVDRLCLLLEAKVNEVAESPGRSRVTKRWRQEVERLIRLDGRTVEQVEYVIKWLGGSTEGGQFWAANVQSGVKLRAKFDQLVARIKSEGNGRARKSAGPSGDDLRQAADRARAAGR